MEEIDGTVLKNLLFCGPNVDDSPDELDVFEATDFDELSKTILYQKKTLKISLLLSQKLRLMVIYIYTLISKV